jgi:hypothetical protein
MKWIALLRWPLALAFVSLMLLRLRQPPFYYRGYEEPLEWAALGAAVAAVVTLLVVMVRAKVARHHRGITAAPFFAYLALVLAELGRHWGSVPRVLGYHGQGWLRIAACAMALLAVAAVLDANTGEKQVARPDSGKAGAE